MSLRNKLIRLAHSKPELRGDLLPLIKEAAHVPGGVPYPYGNAPSWDSLKYDPTKGERTLDEEMKTLWQVFDISVNKSPKSQWDKPDPDEIQGFIAALKRKDHRKAMQIATKYQALFWDHYPTLMAEFWRTMEEQGVGRMPRMASATHCAATRYGGPMYQSNKTPYNEPEAFPDYHEPYETRRQCGCPDEED